MGRAACNSPHLPGSTLSIGGKEVEVDCVITKRDFLSRKLTLPTSAVKRVPSSEEKVVPKQAVPSATRKEVDVQDARKRLNVAAPRSSASKAGYKNPMLQKSAPVKREGSKPVPRHDPNAPGALVMKRPGRVPQGKEIVDVVLDPILGQHLREHQREGVKFLYECVMGMRDFDGQGAILADEMGLGKTLQTIALLWTLLKQNPIYEEAPVIKKALIVCPVTLINNWRKEFRKWLGNGRIGVFVADGTKTRLTDFTMGKIYNVMIIGYEKLRTVQEELKKGAGIDIVIADEGHRLKTAQNKSAQAIKALNTPRRIILSGTPIQNDLSEFFIMADFVNPSLLGTFKTFMKEFEGPIVRSRQPEAKRKDIEKGEAQSAELAGLTVPFILRRTAEILSKYLPAKTEYVLFCKPTRAQSSVYRHVLASPAFQSALGNSEASLQLITVLKKVCNSPSLLTPKASTEAPCNPTIKTLLSAIPPSLPQSAAGSGKLRVLDQLLHNLHTTTTEKVVLVSNYTSTLDLISTLLVSLSYPFLRLDGSTPSAKRQSLVDQFNRTPASTCFAFLLSAKSGGTGLNLIGASRLVLFDVDWNPSTDLQAMARIHRDGQRRECRIYRLLTQGALDEKIFQRQVTKLGLADSVMDSKASVASFSREELRDLFRLDEGARCQTHELLGCLCRGRGVPVVTDNCADTADGDEEGYEEDDLPDLPTLVKASQLDMEAQERRIREAAVASRRKAGASKMQSLMQYLHIDTSGTAAESDAGVDGDVDGELEALVDDEVLLSVLKGEGNGVRFVLAKTSS